MPLTPLDIRHQEFSGQLMGYSKREVRAFLEQIADEMDVVMSLKDKELQHAREMQYEVKQEAVQASNAVEDLKRREELISRTLVFAEKTKADIISNARKEAENIIHEGELKAKRAIQEAKQYLNVLEHQYMHVKEQKRQFLMQFRVELQTFMDRIGKDPMLAKDADQLLDSEFKQLKDEIQPRLDQSPDQNKPAN
ncbi:MAG TPA: DivIVA domain-containing protein [Candidatus Cloacimonadota bacterium]|nr:DivIVA domain-containing protein [Candidatus Cloacimonadota bacterium]